MAGTVPAEWHPEDIKAAVRKRDGMTLAKLARGAGLAETSLRNCLRRPIPRANRVIAAFLSEPLHALWPQWFDVRGRRIGCQRASRSDVEPIAGRRPRHRQKGASA